MTDHAIYFNDLSPEQREEVINSYRSADDPNMLTEWGKSSSGKSSSNSKR